MKREGQSFAAWILGLFLHPPSRGRCSRCGAKGADPSAAKRLRSQGMEKTSRWSLLCAACRRAARDASLREETP